MQMEIRLHPEHLCIRAHINVEPDSLADNGAEHSRLSCENLVAQKEILKTLCVYIYFVALELA